MVLIAPSILSADFLNLEQEIRDIESAGADMIHIDVMDGHFVPNLTIGPMIIKAVRKVAKIPLDVHLMIDNPDCYIETYAKSGADYITIHAESSVHLERVVANIKKLGKKAGLALNPGSSEECIRYLAHELDLVLVMSVNPGFASQTFLESSLEKI